MSTSILPVALWLIRHFQVRGGLPSPLEWNGERQWTFAVSLRQPVIYILRDHINMFTDLGKDWVSGPPTDYYRFVPMIYVFELEMHHFELNLYVNDSNIIDKPLVRDENGRCSDILLPGQPADFFRIAIFTIFGPKLNHQAHIPSNTYRPEVTSIPFFLEAHDLSFVLSLPRWNTRASNHGNRLGKVGFFRLDASYLYFAEVHPEYVEQFKLDITARHFLLDVHTITDPPSGSRSGLSCSWVDHQIFFGHAIKLSRLFYQFLYTFRIFGQAEEKTARRRSP